MEKRAPNYKLIREKARDGGSSEFLWGPPTKDCSNCDTKGLPNVFSHCGNCGNDLGE